MAKKKKDIKDLKDGPVSYKLLPYLSWADKVFNHPAQIQHVCCSTKAGKTYNSGLNKMRVGFDGYHRNQNIWWGAPEYGMCDIFLEEVLPEIYPYTHPDYASQLAPLIKINKQTPKTLFFRLTGTKVTYQSAKEADTKVGRGLHRAYLDEIARCKEQFYYNVLTMLTKTRGKLIGFSTPWGKNWWYDEWYKGWDGDELYPANPLRGKGVPGSDKLRKLYKSWRFTSEENPYVTQEQRDLMKLSMPEHVYREVHGAEWMQKGGVVFTNLNNIICLDPTLHDRPQPGHKYVIAWDPAQTRDLNPYSVYDYSVFPFQQKMVNHFPRGYPRENQWDELAQLSMIWNQAPVIYDNTGGSFKFGHGEQLEKRGIQAVPFEFAGIDRKNNAIQQMCMACETGAIQLLMHPKSREEMESYTYNRTKIGNVTYMAPDGKTDDFVTVNVMAVCYMLILNPEKKAMFCDIIDTRRKSLPELEKEMFQEHIKFLEHQLETMNQDRTLTMICMQGIENPREYLETLKKGDLCSTQQKTS